MTIWCKFMDHTLMASRALSELLRHSHMKKSSGDDLALLHSNQRSLVGRRGTAGSGPWWGVEGSRSECSLSSWWLGGDRGLGRNRVWPSRRPARRDLQRRGWQAGLGGLIVELPLSCCLRREFRQDGAGREEAMKVLHGRLRRVDMGDKHHCV